MYQRLLSAAMLVVAVLVLILVVNLGTGVEDLRGVLHKLSDRTVEADQLRTEWRDQRGMLQGVTTKRRKDEEFRDVQERHEAAVAAQIQVYGRREQQ